MELTLAGIRTAVLDMMSSPGRPIGTTAARGRRPETPQSPIVLKGAE